MKKRLLACLVSLVLCAGLWVPAAAADNSIKQVEAGYLFSMILTNGGDLYGCGLNSPESLPLGPDVEMLDDSVSGGDIVPRPQKITDGVVKIASSKAPSSQSNGSFVSGGHTLILKEGGQLYGLGDNFCSQLGQGDRKQHPGLQYIMDDVVDISCSGTASFAITSDGDLYWWGLLMQQNSVHAQYITEPSPVKVLSDVKDVVGGSEHVAVLKNDGSMYGCGQSYYYELGDGTQDYQVLSWIPAGLTASPLPGAGADVFTDVNPGDYFYEPVEWAVERYITNGTSATTFSPKATCTRGQIVTFLHRAFA